MKYRINEERRRGQIAPLPDYMSKEKAPKLPLIALKKRKSGRLWAFLSWLRAFKAWLWSFPSPRRRRFGSGRARLDENVVERAQKLCAMGVSYREIARITSLNEATVRRIGGKSLTLQERVDRMVLAAARKVFRNNPKVREKALQRAMRELAFKRVSQIMATKSEQKSKPLTKAFQKHPLMTAIIYMALNKLIRPTH
jgi:hypothetical protein